MKLLLNIESLIPPLTGIGNYTFNLIEQLQAEDIEEIKCFLGSTYCTTEQALANCVSANSQYVITEKAVGPKFNQANLRAWLRRWTFVYRAREILRNAQLRLRTSQLRGYVYHEPNFMLKTHSGPSVATIHDLSFIHYPQFHPQKRVDWLSSQLPKTLARADFLITDSDEIRNELISDFGVSSNKVRTVYLGAAEVYRPKTAEQTQPALERYGLKHGRYVLFVGTLEPRKGVDTLIDAWCRLPKALREEFPLVLAGAPGWHNEALNNRIKALEVSHGLRQLSFVPGNDLPTLYAGATVFAYPSLYEGFGLPVLEAMSCGVPVICTADTSMAEFTEGSALLVDRGNHEQLTEHLSELLANESSRNAFAEAGLARSKYFSWKRCAQQTLEIYREVTP
ncbi:glycosyltransferase family 4 protein [Pseudomonas baetica]|jgi:alpha-1,3-rhamnosyl/mannosyltransferase|uniref:glycosyltransferase family 4 protein n=1 Tax=Pseudomonas baetica TaxID=674054 RepID=UPI001C8BBD81|nr:glycosyltransferase family 1 protein [Pseudomonas baetica]MBX9409682.1 glycosyltransferase family 4 protein [Pseudomonas baetica]